MARSWGTNRSGRARVSRMPRRPRAEFSPPPGAARGSACLPQVQGADGHPPALHGLGRPAVGQELLLLPGAVRPPQAQELRPEQPHPVGPLGQGLGGLLRFPMLAHTSICLPLQVTAGARAARAWASAAAVWAGPAPGAAPGLPSGSSHSSPVSPSRPACRPDQMESSLIPVTAGKPMARARMAQWPLGAARPSASPSTLSRSRVSSSPGSRASAARMTGPGRVRGPPPHPAGRPAAGPPRHVVGPGPEIGVLQGPQLPGEGLPRRQGGGAGVGLPGLHRPPGGRPEVRVLQHHPVQAENVRLVLPSGTGPGGIAPPGSPPPGPGPGAAAPAPGPGRPPPPRAGRRPAPRRTARPGPPPGRRGRRRSSPSSASPSQVGPEEVLQGRQILLLAAALHGDGHLVPWEAPRSIRAIRWSAGADRSPFRTVTALSSVRAKSASSMAGRPWSPLGWVRV